MTDSEALATEFLALSGSKTRAAKLAAWALLLHSPFEVPTRTTSWIGGMPRAPATFKWPADDDGSPMLFLAQINLADLAPEPDTATRAPGLPDEGSLLVFIGKAYSCHVLSKEEVADAEPLSLPDGLPSARQHGFFCYEPTFPCWPVRPVAYLDDGAERPTAFPDRFARPEDWIVNWGLAALDTEIAIDCLTKELREAERFLEFEKRQIEQGHPLGAAEHLPRLRTHYRQMLQDAPGLLDELTRWRDRASAQPPEQVVDRAALADIYGKRCAFSEAIIGSYAPKHVLPGRAANLWKELLRRHDGRKSIESFANLPPAFRSFVDAWITDWRGHRLFGIEPPFPNNFEDLRGQDCLISIAADELLSTKSEHDYGLSIWIPQPALARGAYERGQLVRHCAV